MYRSLSLPLSLLLASMVYAQDLENNPNYVKVSHWEMHVIAGGGRVVEKQGPFRDHDGAYRAALRWIDEHPNNIGLLTSEKEIFSYQLIKQSGANRQQDPTSASNSAQRPGGGGNGVADKLSGRWDTQCGPFYFKNGAVQHLCKGQPFSGTYRVQGNSITIDLDDVVIRGTLSGGTINGTIFKNGTMVRSVTISKSW